MGSKPKPPPEPQWNDSIIKQGGNVIGTSKKVGNTIETEYFPDPAEVERKNRINSRINELLATRRAFEPQLRTNTPQFMEGVDNAYNSFMNQEKKAVEEAFNPMFVDVRNDIFRRFGTNNTSIMQDELDRVSRQKADILKDIVERGQLTKQDLAQRELNNKMNYWNALGQELGSLQAGNDGLMNQAQLAYQSTLAPSEMLNNFNLGIWKSKFDDYSRQRNKPSIFGSLFGGMSQFF